MSESIVVLHVDDEAEFGTLVTQFLEREDDAIEVHTETGARAGLNRLGEQEEEGVIDCVVSDFDMPGMSGLELLDAVRERHEDLPFILFTGKGSEAVASDAIARGATDYLQKRTGREQYELLANRIRNAVEQHRAKIERRRNERRFEAVFEDPQMLVALLDADGRLEAANETAMALIDQSHAAVVGTPFPETPWWSDEVREDVREWIERAADGEYIEYSDDRIYAEGRPGSAQGTIRPVRDDDGEVTSLIVSARSTTEQVRSQQRFEAVFNHTDRFLGLLDPDGQVVEVNDPALSHGDLDPDAVEGDPVWEVPWLQSSADTRETIREAVERACDGESVRETVEIERGGTSGTVEFSVTPVTDSAGDVVFLVVEGRQLPHR